MKKSTLFLIVFVSFALFACSAALPQAPLAASTQLPVPTLTQPLASVPSPEHPVILGKWTIDETKPLEAKYYGVDVGGKGYAMPFSFSIGEVGKQVEFTQSALICDAVAYEYQWVDNQRIKLAVDIAVVGTAWLVYDLKLDGGKLSLLDDRDGSAVIVLSRP